MKLSYLALLFFACTQTAFGSTLKELSILFSSTEISLTTKTEPDKDLVLVTVIVQSKRILRISFNGNEGSNGTLKIYNAAHELVQEANFELIKSPFYASVDITGLQPAAYSVVLTTGQGSHTSAFTVK